MPMANANARDMEPMMELKNACFEIDQERLDLHHDKIKIRTSPLRLGSDDDFGKCWLVCWMSIIIIW